MSKKRIVVVDDDESIRKTFFLLLASSYDVYLARDTAEALTEFKKADIDLIIGFPAAGQKWSGSDPGFPASRLRRQGSSYFCLS